MHVNARPHFHFPLSKKKYDFGVLWINLYNKYSRDDQARRQQQTMPHKPGSI
eukprot:c13515_g1_i1 orf=1-153(-)